MDFNLALSYCGIGFSLWILYKILSLVFVVVRLYIVGPSLDYRKFGKWALITGCTSGIGKEFTLYFAKLGLNLILVSRSSEKLEKLSNDIERKFDVDTKVIVKDFLSTDGYDMIGEEVKDLDIGILVNNVGTSAEQYKFHIKEIDKSLNHNEKIINCNLLSVVKMTEVILPKMLNRKSGLIINISSTTANMLCGALTTYSGTKRFVDNFTQGLSYEYKDSGVIFQSVLPGAVLTNMIRKISSKPNFFVPYPDAFVGQCANAIGKTGWIYGYLSHHIQMSMLSMVPERYIASSIKTYFKKKTKDLKQS